MARICDGAQFVSYLTDKPFRYFDHINVKTVHPSFKETSDWSPAEEARLLRGNRPNPQGGYLVTPQLHRARRPIARDRSIWEE